MKKIIIIICLFFAAQIKLFAQSQWKFHIAFEDATGSKDTIWLIWDTSASGGVIGIVDTLLGEGKTSIDYLQFNTFLINDNYDTTKTLAFPFQYSLFTEVKAINYIPPIKISWDSSLFHKPGIPPPVGFVNVAFISNDYFFLVNNDPYHHRFNMLLDNQINALEFNWGSQNQFPMNVSFSRDPSLGIEAINTVNKLIKVSPNPANNYLIVNAEDTDITIQLYSIEGELINSLNEENFNQRDYKQYNISQIPSGLYLIKINYKLTNRSSYEKIIIIH